MSGRSPEFHTRDQSKGDIPVMSNNLSSPIRTNGVQIDLGDALPQHVQERLLTTTETYFQELKHASVGFRREGQSYCCTINILVGNFRMMIGEASAPDFYRAFDLALEKVAVQLRRRKRRLDGAVREEVRAGATA
jgi:ribosomal subunit interface protein